MKKITLISLLVCLLLVMTGCGKKDDIHEIRITIPAGNKDTCVFSEEVVIPKWDYFYMGCGEGLTDRTKIEFKSAEDDELMIWDFEPYLNPGEPFKVHLKRGAGFRIGVYVDNLTGQDMDVYVKVTNAEVRSK